MTSQSPIGDPYRPAYCHCGKPATMWTPGSFCHGYYCDDHIPVGFEGTIPEQNLIANEPGVS